MKIGTSGSLTELLQDLYKDNLWFRSLLLVTHEFNDSHITSLLNEVSDNYEDQYKNRPCIRKEFEKEGYKDIAVYRTDYFYDRNKSVSIADDFIEMIKVREISNIVTERSHRQLKTIIVTEGERLPAQVKECISPMFKDVCQSKSVRIPYFSDIVLAEYPDKPGKFMFVRDRGNYYIKTLFNYHETR